MEIRIKKFDVNMAVKSKGIEFEVRSPDGSHQVGDCYLTMTGLVWCKGKTGKPNGVKLPWKDLAIILDSGEAKKAAIAAAKNA